MAMVPASVVGVPNLREQFRLFTGCRKQCLVAGGEVEWGGGHKPSMHDLHNQ